METIKMIFIFLGSIGVFTLILLVFWKPIAFLLFDFKWKRFWRQLKKFFKFIFTFHQYTISGKVIECKVEKEDLRNFISDNILFKPTSDNIFNYTLEPILVDRYLVILKDKLGKEYSIKILFLQDFELFKRIISSNEKIKAKFFYETNWFFGESLIKYKLKPI